LAAESFVGLNPPYINIKVHFEPSGPDFEVEGLVDTGFEGHIAMPAVRLPTTIRAAGNRVMVLADGTLSTAEIYDGIAGVIGLDQSVAVSITLGSREILIGRRFIDYSRVTFDHGREVTVEP
jgi:predicted aspartyl protease